MKERLALVLACAATALSAFGPVQAAAPVATLGLGDAAFWGSSQGTFTEAGWTEFTLHLIEGGHVLRVAIDDPNGAPYFEVASPGGAVTQTDNGWLSLEVFVATPAAGDHVVRVFAEPARGFRMRARLEDAPPPPPSEPEQLLPNLRMVPPHDFTFFPPTFGVGIPGLPNCSVQEVLETSGRRCLRFSLGPSNVGPGPLEVVFQPLQGLVTPGTAHQRVYSTDGSFIEREAGTFEYHKTHMHYHHSGFGKLELFRVTDPDTGELTLAGTGPKQGFCTGDVMIATWSTFIQAREKANSECIQQAATTGTNNPTGTTMGLTPGWADLYSWSQDGNYVEWGSNGEGLYVVRAAADSNDWIDETDESDNVSYAYIRVTGEHIQVLERGYGTDPWDPNKTAPEDLLPGAL